MSWQNLVDFLVLAAVFYFLLVWSRQTRALRLTLAMLALHVAGTAAIHSDLVITGWLLHGASIVALALLVIVFLPEIRHALMQLDSLLRLGLYPKAALGSAYRGIAEAAFEMAREHTGALIAVVRRDSIGELIEGGTPLRAEISPALLHTVFQKGSPLHDGAVVVEGDQIVHAGAVLPLTSRTDVPFQFGTRHRAAMGLAARSDAVVVAVSEQRGEVTLFERGEFELIPSAPDLVARLQQLQAEAGTRPAGRWRRAFMANWGMKFAALGLAAAVWGISFVGAGTSIKTIRVPVEFVRVPPGLEISEQSATTVECQVRASPWVFDSISISGLSARFDLRGASEGPRLLPVEASNIDLPPGVIVDLIQPPELRIRLARRR